MAEGTLEKLFLCFISFFLFGIFLASIFEISFHACFFLVLVGVALILIGLLKNKECKLYFLASFAILSLVLGVFRFSSVSLEERNSLPVLQKKFWHGQIVREPDERENSVLLTVDLSEEKEKILIFANKGEVYRFGEVVKVFGQLQDPESFETEGGRIFDYKSYLLKEGVRYVMYQPNIEAVGISDEKPITRLLLSVKSAFIKKYEAVIAEPESSLLGGILLGLKQGLGEDWTEILRRSGIVHIVVLSGYNIAIIVFAVTWFLRKASILARVSLGSGIIVLFSIMVGGGATVVRAAVMALLVLLSQVVKRRYDVTRALILAGFLMVLHNPHILVFDLSFQLSFLATVGLIYLSPIIKPYAMFVPEVLSLREIVVATVATQIFVLPFLLYSIGTISAVSLLVNLLVLPAVPLAMFFGFLTGISGFLFEALSQFFGLITYGLLHYILKVAKFFGELSFASYEVQQFPPSIMFLSYVFIVVFILSWHRKQTPAGA